MQSIDVQGVSTSSYLQAFVKIRFAKVWMFALKTIKAMFPFIFPNIFDKCDMVFVSSLFKMDMSCANGFIINLWICFHYLILVDSSMNMNIDTKYFGLKLFSQYGF